MGQYSKTMNGKEMEESAEKLGAAAQTLLRACEDFYYKWQDVKDGATEPEAIAAKLAQNPTPFTAAMVPDFEALAGVASDLWQTATGGVVAQADRMPTIRKFS